MRRKLSAAAILAAILAVSPLGSSMAQVAPTPASQPNQGAGVGDWLRRGHALESERRWGEALTHYEDGLRQFPGDGSLKGRFDEARLHYELSRRYNDRSFREGLTRMPTDEALDLYSDVLLKVQSHYVETPKWKELVEHGTRALEVALSERSFIDNNGLRASAASVENFRQELRQTLGPRVVQSRDDAREAVASAASLAQKRLAIAPSAVVLEYTCGATTFLDQYSAFLTPDQLNEVYSQIEGNFVGLGVELKAQDGVLTIVRVIPNSPAKRAGVRDGDRILAVNGQSTKTLSTDRAANLLQGEAGTTVDITLARPNEGPRQVTVKRERVEVPSVDESQILDPQQGVAYLKLTCFQKTTFRDLDTALWNLHRAGMKKLIIDLRGNPGGLLISAVEVADLFLAQGVIVSTHGRNVHEDFTYSAREAGTWRVPLVLVVDQDSASAAEIFAGAIRDHHRGTIVGKRSYGKGSVQGIFPLNVANAGLRLTTAKFFSPTGQPYSGVGVEPHVMVHQTAKPVNASAHPALSPSEDPMLAAALQAILQPVAQRQ